MAAISRSRYWIDDTTLAWELAQHLWHIAALALDTEPDWDAVYEGADHSWCHEASHLVAARLNEHELAARVVRGGLAGNQHEWVELSDGTIIDATICQYIDRTEDRCIDPAQVPWQTSPDDDLVAVIAPGHPFAAHYHRP